MEFQQNLNDMLEELSSSIFILQSDIIKVMNGINKLNLIISKIKQYQSNNMNNNMMINNMMNNIPNLNMDMNNMMNMMNMQRMNPQMPMNVMSNNMINFNLPDENEKWNLNFEDKSYGNLNIINVKISPEKFVKDAIDIFLQKTGITDELKFICNCVCLIPEQKISQSVLRNLSTITVLHINA